MYLSMDIKQIFDIKELKYLIYEYVVFIPKTKIELKNIIIYYDSYGYDFDKIDIFTQYGKMNDWDVSNITDMSYLFSDLFDFNEPIGNWDVSNVTNMSHMFYGAQSFNKNI